MAFSHSKTLTLNNSRWKILNVIHYISDTLYTFVQNSTWQAAIPKYSKLAVETKKLENQMAMQFQ